MGSAEEINRKSFCHLCSKVAPPFQRAIAAGTYRTTLRALIHSLKYDGMLAVADGLGRRLARTILLLEPQIREVMGSGGLDGTEDQMSLGLSSPAMELRECQKLLVIPVPAYSSNRRFNHAALIASAALLELRSLRRDWRMSFAPELLQRQRETESQAGLTPHQRRVNVRGAFRTPNVAALENAHVLLIDDIYTTGATARACTKALLKAGAASVWVATVARAQFEHIIRPQIARFEEASLDGKDLGEDLPMHEDVAFWDLRSKAADGSSTGYGQHKTGVLS